jgi:hypothetical protein
MSRTFCSLNEAFSEPPTVPPSSKKKKHRREQTTTEGFQNLPQQLSANPMTNSAIPDQLMQSPAVGVDLSKMESAMGGGDFFPLPGNTADNDEWAKAFTLQPSQIPKQLSTPFVADGKPTLWRSVEPTAATFGSTQLTEIQTPLPTEINRRLDMLARQIESLTTPTPLQSTAELFLFVAIGLLLLLAIDTLLRFATRTFSKPMRGGGGRMRGGWSVR